MPIRTNQEGTKSNKSGWVYKKLDVVETVELRKQVPEIKATAITQVQQTVASWDMSQVLLELMILREATT